MEEWQQGHDKFTKAKQNKLARNRERLIKERVGRKCSKVANDNYRNHYDETFGKKEEGK
jgi:hypothetical protein